MGAISEAAAMPLIVQVMHPIPNLGDAILLEMAKKLDSKFRYCGPIRKYSCARCGSTVRARTYCKSAQCTNPECRKARQRRQMRAAARVLVQSDFRRLRIITFTMVDQPIAFYTSEIRKKLDAALRNVMKKFRVSQWVKAVEEVTSDRVRSHYHFHVIADSEFIPHDQLRDEWYEELRDIDDVLVPRQGSVGADGNWREPHENLNVDIELIRAPDGGPCVDLSQVLRYIVKYTTKTIDDESKWQVYRKGRRVIEACGQKFQYKIDWDVAEVFTLTYKLWESRTRDEVIRDMELAYLVPPPEPPNPNSKKSLWWKNLMLAWRLQNGLEDPGLYRRYRRIRAVYEQSVDYVRFLTVAELKSPAPPYPVGRLPYYFPRKIGNVVTVHSMMYDIGSRQVLYSFCHCTGILTGTYVGGVDDRDEFDLPESKYEGIPFQEYTPPSIPVQTVSCKGYENPPCGKLCFGMFL